ncbi:MAG: hypothetical protein AAGH64_04230 [Planctomycetota bacterium]
MDCVFSTIKTSRDSIRPGWIAMRLTWTALTAIHVFAAHAVVSKLAEGPSSAGLLSLLILALVTLLFTLKALDLQAMRSRLPLIEFCAWAAIGVVAHPQPVVEAATQEPLLVMCVATASAATVGKRPLKRAYRAFVRLWNGLFGGRLIAPVTVPVSAHRNGRASPRDLWAAPPWSSRPPPSF